jgi:hypothetical protein
LQTLERVLMGCKPELQKQRSNESCCPGTERVVKCLSGVRRKFHAPFLDEEGE